MVRARCRQGRGAGVQAERAVGWGMIQQAAAQSQCCCMVAPACPGAHLVGQQPLVSQALHCSRALGPDLHVIALDGAAAVVFRALFDSKPEAQMAQPWHRQAVLARHAAARPILRVQGPEHRAPRWARGPGSPPAGMQASGTCLPADGQRGLAGAHEGWGAARAGGHRRGAPLPQRAPQAAPSLVLRAHTEPARNGVGAAGNHANIQALTYAGRLPRHHRDIVLSGKRLPSTLLAQRTCTHT